MHRLGTAVIALVGSLISGAAWAELPRPWQLGMPTPQSTSMQQITDFHDQLLWLITIISLFVLALLIIVVVRFNRKANPTPSTTTHHIGLEVVWTLVPAVILFAIAFPSMHLLYYTDRTENPELTLKVIGNQWYWSYEYPEEGLAFDSLLVPEDDLQEGQIRLLAVDNPVVLPVDTNIRLLLTSNDVIHSWALPQLVHKWDTVPGRINETWVRINEEGTYYGQCSELCGVNHGYMPIVVEAVSKADYAAWLEGAKETFAQGGPDADPAPRVAAKGRVPNGAASSN